MGTTFTAAGAVIESMVAKAIRDYHKDLDTAGVTIDCLLADCERKHMAVPALKKNGYPCAAKISVTSLEDRARGLADAKLVICRFTWTRMSETRRVATVDHELQHLALAYHRPTRRNSFDTSLKLDDQSRPMMRIRPHDWEMGFFKDVVERHGEASPEAGQARLFMEKWGQYCLFQTPSAATTEGVQERTGDNLPPCSVEGCNKPSVVAVSVSRGGKGTHTELCEEHLNAVNQKLAQKAPKRRGRKPKGKTDERDPAVVASQAAMEAEGGK